MTPFRLSAYWLASPALAAVFDAMERTGCPVRAVGGAVRNTLLGVAIHDVDLATSARPDAVMAAADAAGLKAIPTGLSHGTVTVVSEGQPFELTTLRQDVATDGRHAEVVFTDNFALDAERRDFTINALYVDRDGFGEDYVGGVADCNARRVRFIGDANRRILEDHLRILRFFRFHACYAAGPLDEAGLAASVALKARIADLAAERVQSEFLKLVVAPGAASVLAVMAEHNIMAPFTTATLDVEAFVALLAAERQTGRTGTPELLLVALMDFDVAQFDALAVALKMPRRMRDRGLAALAAAAEMPPRTVTQQRALLYRHGSEAFMDALIMALARGTMVPDMDGVLAEVRRWRRPRFPVGGHDLLGQGGEPGPELGERLKHLEAMWRDSDFKLTREALLSIDRQRIAG